MYIHMCLCVRRERQRVLGGGGGAPRSWQGRRALGPRTLAAPVLVLGGLGCGVWGLGFPVSGFRYRVLVSVFGLGITGDGFRVRGQISVGLLASHTRCTRFWISYRNLRLKFDRNPPSFIDWLVGWLVACLLGRLVHWWVGSSLVCS